MEYWRSWSLSSDITNSIFRSVGSAVLYGLTSTSMAFLNKIVLDTYEFNHPIFIMTVQMAVTFLIVRFVNLCGYIELSEITKLKLLKFIPLCFFYSLNGVVSLVALGSMNLTMYSLLKRNGPLITMILSTLILRKGIPGQLVIIGILMMSVGCIIAAEGDMSFELNAYMFGLGSVFSQSLYLIILQILSDKYSTADTLYMNSILGFPVLILITAFSNEWTNVLTYEHYTDIGFIISLLVLLFTGAFLNFTLFLCNSNNTALTTSVVGTLKSVAQTSIGMFTFGGVSFNPAMISGVTINLSGGIFYTYAKYRESQIQKGQMKKIQSKASVTDVENGHGQDHHNT